MNVTADELHFNNFSYISNYITVSFIVPACGAATLPP